MKQEVTNFGRFYCAFSRLPKPGEPEEVRRGIVLQYTGGRTDSLREMSRKEYNEMCTALEGLNGTRDEQRRRRSIVLRLMQELEVDTRDWAQINDFCRHPRIAGKAFGQLTIDELRELATKLRSIKRKGWQRKTAVGIHNPESPKQHITYLINLASPGMSSFN